MARFFFTQSDRCRFRSRTGRKVPDRSSIGAIKSTEEHPAKITAAVIVAISFKFIVISLKFPKPLSSLSKTLENLILGVKEKSASKFVIVATVVFVT